MTASDAIPFGTEPESQRAPRAELPPEAVVVPVAEAALPTVDYDNPSHIKRTPPMRLLALPARRETKFDRSVWPLAALGVALLYFFALYSFWAPAHPGTDQNGYFVGGRQFAHTLSSGMKPASDYGFVGHMWIRAENGFNYPKYPLGLPILFAACLWIFGEARGVEYAHLISPISATLATLGVFAITRRLAGGFVGVMAMLLLACGQVMMTLADNPNSHAACICTVVWGMYFLIRWLETGSIWRGVAAGGLFGIAYTIRYTEGLMLLPIGVALLYAAQWRWPSFRRAAITIGSTGLVVGIVLLIARIAGDKIAGSLPWLAPLAEDDGRMFKLLVAALAAQAIVTTFLSPRSLVRWLAVQLAWAIPVAYLTIFNMVAMHSFTSYAGTNESTGFDLDYFRGNWEKMIRVMNDQGLFFIAPLGVLGLVCMFRRLPLVATLLSLWFVPSVLLYTAYYWAPDNMGVSYSRFILTQLPALVIAAAWLMGDMARRGRHGWVGPIAIGAVVFISCSLGLYRTVLGSEWGQRLNIRANFEVAARQNMNLAGLGREVRRAVDGPAKEKAARAVQDDSDVLLFSDGDRINHLQWIGGWQIFSIDAFNFERTRGYYRQFDENDPDPIDPSRMKFLQGVYKDKDQRTLQADQNALIANALAAGKRVYYVLTDNASKNFSRQIDRKQFDVKDVGSFNDVPSPRKPEEFLLPDEKPKQPVNRFGRGNNAFAGPSFLGNEKLFFRIGQVVKKPPSATPATVPATKPATKAASRPTTKTTNPT
jgi:4-amino-4-deoxy-L-arabinose transferase-like glycosyltransferase